MGKQGGLSPESGRESALPFFVQEIRAILRFQGDHFVLGADAHPRVSFFGLKFPLRTAWRIRLTLRSPYH